MQIISSILTKVGLFLLLLCPLYQGFDAWIIKNEPGDGMIVSGDNVLFRNIIGVKTVYSDLIPGYCWNETGWKIVTPPWMQSIGLPKVVVYGEKENVGSGNQATSIQITVWLLRWMIKIMIPGIFLLCGYLLQKKQLNELKPQAI